MTRVKEIMRCDVPSVSPSASIVEVAQKLRDCGTGTLPVCEKGKLRGVITERDIVCAIVATADDPTTGTAGSLMRKRQPTISPGDDITRAARVMADNGVRLLPVAQNGQLLGLLTLENLGRESLALAAWVFSRNLKTQALRKTKVLGENIL